MEREHNFSPEKSTHSHEVLYGLRSFGTDEPIAELLLEAPFVSRYLRCIVISGITGAGKTTVIEQYKDQIRRIYPKPPKIRVFAISETVPKFLKQVDKKKTIDLDEDEWHALSDMFYQDIMNAMPPSRLSLSPLLKDVGEFYQNPPENWGDAEWRNFRDRFYRKEDLEEIPPPEEILLVECAGIGSVEKGGKDMTLSTLMKLANQTRKQPEEYNEIFFLYLVGHPLVVKKAEEIRTKVAGAANDEEAIKILRQYHIELTGLDANAPEGTVIKKVAGRGAGSAIIRLAQNQIATVARAPSLQRYRELPSKNLEEGLSRKEKVVFRDNIAYALGYIRRDKLDLPADRCFIALNSPIEGKLLVPTVENEDI